MYAMSKRFSKAAIQRLQHYSWPGNIRELKNVVERLVVTSGSSLIRETDLTFLNLEENQLGYLPDESAFSVQVNDVVPLEQAVEAVEKQLLLLAKQKLAVKWRST